MNEPNGDLPITQSNAGQSLELATKLVAIASAACLATAFLYDMVFFSVVERRLISLLVLSDHLETAISFVPWFVAGLAVVTVVFYFDWDRIPNYLFFGFSLVWLVAILAFARWVLFKNWWGTVALFATVFIFTILISRIFLFKDVTSGQSQFRPLQALPPALMMGWALASVLFFSFALALMAGYEARRVCELPQPDRTSSLSDLVTLDKGASISGRVVRIASRGVILVGCDPFSAQFVPIDQVKKIEMKRRSS